MRIAFLTDRPILYSSLLENLRKKWLVELVKRPEELELLSHELPIDLVIVTDTLPNGVLTEAACHRLTTHKQPAPVVIGLIRSPHTARQLMQTPVDDIILWQNFASIVQSKIEIWLARSWRLGSAHENSQLLIESGALQLDLGKGQVRYQNHEVSIRRKELQLLAHLMKHHCRVLSKDQLRYQIWESGRETSNNTIEATIKSLRAKLKKLHADQTIQTVYGLGYRFVCRKCYYKR